MIFSRILCLCLQAVKNWFISLLWQWSPLESQISIALLGALAQVTANVIIILIQFAYFNKYKLVVRASVQEQWAKWRRWKDHNCHLANFKRLSCFLDFAEKLMTGLKKRSYIKWSTKCFFFFVVCTIYFYELKIQTEQNVGSCTAVTPLINWSSFIKQQNKTITSENTVISRVLWTGCTGGNEYFDARSINCNFGFVQSADEQEDCYILK